MTRVTMTLDNVLYGYRFVNMHILYVCVSVCVCILLEVQQGMRIFPL